MAGSPAHPHAMSPSNPARTQTAAPRKPASWPSHPRMRVYTLFGATGFLYLVVGFVILRLVWDLGAGPDPWQGALERLSNPFYVIFHLVTLVGVVFVGVRFFRLFPKAQPARIGPLKPPPGHVIQVMLYAAWLGVTLLFALVLTGVIF